MEKDFNLFLADSAVYLNLLREWHQNREFTEVNMKAYRVFDDEWSDVCGPEQLKEFAYDQIGWLDESDYREANDRLVNIIADFQENNPVPADFSIEDAKNILDMRCYEVEELELR